MKLILILNSLLIFTTAAVRLGFYGLNTSDVAIFTLSSAVEFSLISGIYYDPSKVTIIYIHGWNDVTTFDSKSLHGSLTVVPSSEFSEEIIGALLLHKLNFNVAAFDWSEIALNQNIFDVIGQIQSTAKLLIKILNQLNAEGFKVNQIYAIGFSFGATIAGIAGRFFKQSGNSWKRITAFDPVGLGGKLSAFYMPKSIERLSIASAKFVDVIHTNVNFLGDKNCNGHANFWVNGGRTQKTCSHHNERNFSSPEALFTFLGCSHKKSFKFFVESVKRNSTILPFIARKCKSGEEVYDKLTCKEPEMVSMGFYADLDVNYEEIDDKEVHYYVETNDKAPFSKT